MIAPMNEIDLMMHLSNCKIDFSYYAHPAVMTSAEAASYMSNAPGVSGKNLFLRDKKGRRYILLMTLGEKRVALKKWGEQEVLGKLSFADSQSLADYLGVSSGAVGPLALINDTQHRIEVFIDTELWEHGYFHCHPLVNTASLVLTTKGLEDFFLMTGHFFKVVNVPSIE